MKRIVASSDTLASLQSELNDALADRQQVLNDITRPGNTMRGTHMADAAESSFNDQFVLSQLNKKIAALSTSIALINGNAYGICVDCKKAISSERMKAHKTAKRCVPCQERHEQIGGR